MMDGREYLVLLRTEIRISVFFFLGMMIRHIIWNYGGKGNLDSTDVRYYSLSFTRGPERCFMA
jgi:hypothetical protein